MSDVGTKIMWLVLQLAGTIFCGIFVIGSFSVRLPDKASWWRGILIIALTSMFASLFLVGLTISVRAWWRFL